VAPPLRRRRRPSSIDKLDPEIRDLIGKLRIDKGWSIDEIRAQLEKMLGEEHLPSRSALGRHVKSLEEIGAELRKSREIATALVSQLGAGAEDRTAELNIELMHTAVLNLLTSASRGEDGEPVMMEPDTIKALSQSLKSLGDARKANADLVLRARKAAKEEAAVAAAGVAKAQGFSADTVDLIRKAVLGSGT
jgi:DnaJ-domain-containing protein 1